MSSKKQPVEKIALTGQIVLPEELSKQLVESQVANNINADRANRAINVALNDRKRYFDRQLKDLNESINFINQRIEENAAAIVGLLNNYTNNVFNPVYTIEHGLAFPANLFTVTETINRVVNVIDLGDEDEETGRKYKAPHFRFTTTVTITAKVVPDLPYNISFGTSRYDTQRSQVIVITQSGDVLVTEEYTRLIDHKEDLKRQHTDLLATADKIRLKRDSLWSLKEDLLLELDRSALQSDETAMAVFTDLTSHLDNLLND